MMDSFELEKRENIERLARDADLRVLSVEWITRAARYQYSHHFTWMGRPVIQFPQDIVAMQEIVWEVKPDLIVETGIARGGSLIFYASLLELIGGEGMVLGVDIEIRPHNRDALKSHSMFKRIRMIEGSALDEAVVCEVRKAAQRKQRVLVVLDSNHTHDHVFRELQLYSPLVTKGSYLVVFDTIIEDMPAGSFPDRPWDKGNNPKTAVREFLKTTNRFEVARDIEAKLLITVAPEGYLRCVKE